MHIEATMMNGAIWTVSLALRKAITRRYLVLHVEGITTYRINHLDRWAIQSA